MNHLSEFASKYLLLTFLMHRVRRSVPISPSSINNLSFSSSVVPAPLPLALDKVSTHDCLFHALYMSLFFPNYTLVMNECFQFVMFLCFGYQTACSFAMLSQSSRLMNAVDFQVLALNQHLAIRAAIWGLHAALRQAVIWCICEQSWRWSRWS